MAISSMQVLEHPVYQKVAPQLPRALALVFLILIALSAARLVWLMLAPAPELPQTSIQNSKTTVTRLPVADFAATIARQSIFGKPVVVAAAEPTTPEEIPETRLNLKLRGVFALNDEDGGLALISNGSGPEKVYQVDDAISRSTKLAAVYPDRVKLSINGKFETLRLPETKDTGVSYVPTANTRATGNNRTVPKPSTVETKSLGEYRKEFMRNPTTLARLVNVSKATDSTGNAIGYKVSANGKHPAFDQLGIEDGDVITSINGIQLDSDAKGMSAFQALRQAQQVTVQILRNGQPNTLNLTF